MVAFRLPATTNLQAIFDGHRDVVLARPSRSRHGADRLPRLGRSIHLSTPGNESYAPVRFSPRQVVFRADVSFSADGVVRIIAAESLRPGTIEGVHALLRNAEQGSPAINRGLQADVFARRAGFVDYADLWRSLRASDADVVHRVVIQWGSAL